MSRNGYIKLYRKIIDNDILQQRPYTRRDAWIDLLLHANYEPKEVWIKNTKYICDVGEQLRSQRNIAEHWGWSRGRVRTFLTLIQNQAMITFKNEPHTTRIKIVNWDTYQCEDEKKSHEMATTYATKKPRNDITKNIKNIKNNKNKNNSASKNNSRPNRSIISNNVVNIANEQKILSNKQNNTQKLQNQFDAIWNKYPKKLGKKAAIRHYKNSVKSEKDLQNIQKALNKYLKSKNVKEGYIQNGSTWFNNWEDWVDYEDGIKSDYSEVRKLLDGKQP